MNSVLGLLLLMATMALGYMLHKTNQQFKEIKRLADDLMVTLGRLSKRTEKNGQ